MSDDHDHGGRPPEPPPTPPVFLAPGSSTSETPVPPGTPATSPGPWQQPLPPPPAPGPQNWPPRFALISAALGFVVAQVVIGLVAIFYFLAGGQPHDSGFIVGASILQDLVFIFTAVVVAGWAGPVRVAYFGLLRAPFWPTVGKVVVVAVTYFTALAVYSKFAHLVTDDTADDLGAGNGTLGMIGFVVMAAIVAPVAEEFFFRGMVFRALANGMGVLAAAIVSGVLFGALHIDSFSADRLLQVVALAALGVLFALLYAWSGTLYSTIALHATNNALAVIVFANSHKSQIGEVLTAIAWLGMMTFCINGWRLTDRESVEPATDLAGLP